MIFNISQENFIYGLQTVSRSISTRTTLPILTGILLEAHKDELRLTATDLEIGIEMTVPAKVKEPGAIVLPARQLLEIVRRIPGGDIELQTENLKAVITWGESIFKLNGNDPLEYPGIPEMSNSQINIEFNQTLLRELINQIIFAVSHDDTRPILTGVNFSVSNNALTAIATDGSRIATKTVSVITNVTEKTSFVIPAKSLQEVQRILVPDTNSIILKLDKKQVQFSLSNITVFTRLLEGQYPEVLRLLPTEYLTKTVLSTTDFQSACERASLLADSRQTFRLLKLNIAKNNVTVIANDPEMGSAEEKLSATVEGEEITIGFNAKYLIDGLKNLADEEVVFETIDGSSPARLKSANVSNFFYVVLPVRLS